MIRVNDIIVPENDERNYRGLILENGMQVMLISDVKTEKAAAALDVHVGFMCDPKNLPGLAHFCEHMLFNGTEKYPSENDYNKYMSDHGGSNNAFTTMDHTTFYFDIAFGNFADALDRFSQFFISPLFTESMTEREVQAIHQEHEKNISIDSWRIDQYDKSTSDSNHDFNRFGTGTRETLLTIPKSCGINIRDELLKFHQEWYSSDVMNLVLLARESLDELENLCFQYFSQVPKKNVKVKNWIEHPFGPEQLQIKSFVVPVKDLRILSVTFPLPDLSEHFESKPLHYLSHLLGHEGAGSLLSALKKRGFSSSLVSGSRSGAKGFGFFSVDVDLTEKGIENIDDIITLIFQYIKLLKTNEPLKWISDENDLLARMNFRFKDKRAPASYVTGISRSMSQYPLNKVISAPYLCSKWEPELISKVLTYLSPSFARIMVVGKCFEKDANKTERWYGTKYRLEKIPPELIARWEAVELCDELKLPLKNNLIPTNFDLHPTNGSCSQFPLIIRNDHLFQVWHKQDTEFLLPKANVTFQLRSPLAYLDPYSADCTYLFVNIFKDYLTEFSYIAELAGLRWDMNNTKYGISLSIGGFNHKQEQFLDEIMQKMVSLKIDEQRFLVLKENYIRKLNNFKAEPPHQHADYYMTALLFEQLWVTEELLSATEFLTKESLEKFIPQFFSNLFIESLVHGNVTKEKALNLSRIVERYLKHYEPIRALLPQQRLLFREVRLPDASNYYYEAENGLHKSNCIAMYFQTGEQSTRNNALLELLAHILREPAYDTLRTKEQLGYIVFTGVRRSNSVQGLRIIIQSDKHPFYLEERIDNFLTMMKDRIENMDQDELTNHVEAIAVSKLERPKNLSELSHKFWSEIISQEYNFDRNNTDVKMLRSLSKGDILDFFSEFDRDSPLRHKLSIHILSSVDQDSPSIPHVMKADNGAQKIVNITDFKASHGLFHLRKTVVDFQSHSTESKS